jgi:hypothetical protein
MILLLALLLSQDDLDGRLRALGEKLAPDGPSAALAELCRSEHGRAALLEKVQLLVEHAAARLDRDPLSVFQEHYFAADATGALRVRPERQADFERLARDIQDAPQLMAPFNRRVLELVGRIAGDGPLETRARAWWADSAYRVAFFASRSDELRERDLTALRRERFEAPPGEILAWLNGLAARAEAAKELEGAYLKNLAGLDDDTRRELVTDAASLFVLGRILRQREEEVPNALASVEEPEIAFRVPLTDLPHLIREGAALLAELSSLFERDAAGLSAEAAALLRQPRVRALAVEEFLGRRQEDRARAEAVVAEILADGFEAEGAKLRVKPGRYKGEGDVDSAEVLDAEHRAVVDGFRGGRRDLDLIAEHCADPKAAWVFASAEGTLRLRERIERLVAERRAAVEARGVELFRELYLAREGERWTVRAERAAKVTELGRRADEILRGR